MKLLIRNIARDLSEDSLKKLFEAHGQVQSCSIVMDAKTGVSKGFGYVGMPRSGETKAAMKTMNGTEVSGCKIRVKKAE